MYVCRSVCEWPCVCLFADVPMSGPVCLFVDVFVDVDVCGPMCACFWMCLWM